MFLCECTTLIFCGFYEDKIVCLFKYQLPWYHGYKRNGYFLHVFIFHSDLCSMSFLWQYYYEKLPLKNQRWKWKKCKRKNIWQLKKMPASYSRKITTKALYCLNSTQNSFSSAYIYSKNVLHSTILVASISEDNSI